MSIKLINTMLIGLVLALSACDGGKDAGKKGADEKAPTAKAPTEEPQDKPEKQVEVPALDPKVEQAVTLANKISSDPESADSILEAAGMDRDAFEKLLYEIARDPELSKSYAVAREA
ncbi:MAG: hypothetical protein R6X02_08820 [Enhygromyxa sp.]